MILTFVFITSITVTLLSASASGARFFQIEMTKPGHFRIQPLVPGPVSSSLVGGGPNQQLITLQEQGHTIVYAVIPAGAKLVLQVGSHRLRLSMVDANHYEVREE
jgi:hypothetical protein